MRGRVLFDKVVEMCGISGVLGPGLVRRALSDWDVDPDHGMPEDYEEALPRLQNRLATYVPPDEAIRRIHRVSEMLAQARAELDSENEAERSVFGTVVEVLRVTDADLEAEESWRLMQTGERVKEGVELPEGGGKNASNGD